MLFPTMLQYLDKTGKDVTQETTGENPNFKLCLETTRTFRGLGQSGENNITTAKHPRESPAFSSNQCRINLTIQSTSDNSNVWVIEGKIYILIYRDLYSLLTETRNQN